MSKTNKYKIVAPFLISALTFVPFFTTTSCAQQEIDYALPSANQLAWHHLEQSAFIHFSLSTFTGKEFGPDPDGEFGNEPPTLFNPTNLDADKWVETFKEAGFKQVILVCKHHDGFCLWPSAYTDRTVASSPWKNGQGDLVKDVSVACQKYGLKFGVYLSPWDASRSDWGLPSPDGTTPNYVQYYRNQLTELLTNYGPISEVWFDGAKGGTSKKCYYGGANGAEGEGREVSQTWYDWENTYKLVRRLQPNAVMSQGPDIRWCGNESGTMQTVDWNTFNCVYPEAYSMPESEANKNVGVEGGKYWLPAEADVSIDNRWFWKEGDPTKTGEMLFNIYLESVGRGAGLLLNVPPTNTGELSTEEIQALQQFKTLKDNAFTNNIAENAVIKKEDDCYSLDLGNDKTVNYVVLGEDIRMGQSIKSVFMTLKQKNGTEVNIHDIYTVGNKVIYKLLTPTLASTIFIQIEDSLRPHPILSNIQIF